MSIAVLVKQVPDTTSKISIANGRVDESSVSKWAISPYDEYALEAALQLKESGFGSLIAITCGPARSAKCLTDAAAVGADELIHVKGSEDVVEGKGDDAYHHRDSESRVFWPQIPEIANCCSVDEVARCRQPKNEEDLELDIRLEFPVRYPVPHIGSKFLNCLRVVTALR